MKPELPNSEKEVLDAISNLKLPFTPNSKSEARQRIMETIHNSENENEAIGVRLFYQAAGIALAIGLVSFLLLYQNKTIENVGETAMTCELPCKTQVSLYPGSKLSFNSFTYSFKRKVNISGEAFFDVTKGAPFTAFSPQGKVRVLGTAFEMWAGNTHLFVHCQSGQVQVDTGDKKTNLLASEFIQIKNGIPGVKRVYPCENRANKRDINILRFNSAPVELVIAHLERALDVEIECRIDPATVYTGVLDTRRGEECLTIFCKPFGAQIQFLDKDHITISP